ncbi:MAG: NADH-quinone oxidoreductase subunit H [Janthinobacterium lividum]
MIALLLHLAVMLAAAPLVAGLAGWSAARLGGREGPSVLQPWRTLRRLARKPAVRPEGTSWVFAQAPAASLALGLAGAALVPSFTLGMTTAPLADLLVVGGLLAAARAVLCCGLIDGGGAAGGAAAARLVADGVAGAAALALVVLAVALLAGGTNLDAAVAALHDGRGGGRVALALALAAAVLAALERAGRVPVEDGVAAAGEWSGRDLALVRAGEMLSALVWLGLAAALFLPLHPAPSGAPWPWGGGVVPGWGAAGAAVDGGAGPLLAGGTLAELPGLWAQGLAGWAIKIGAGALLLGGVRAVAPRRGTQAGGGLAGVATLLAGLAVLLALLGGAGA